MTQDLRMLEALFSRNFYNGDAIDAARFQKADGYFLLTAPHATNRWQDGRRRSADRYTGSLVQLIGSLAGQSWLATDGIAPEWNYWDERHDAFKEHLDEVLDEGRYLVNIVGASPRYGADIHIGLGTDPSQEALDMAELVEDSFGDFHVITAGSLNATEPRSVRSYAKATGSDEIQLALAPTMRDAVEHPRITMAPNVIVRVRRA